MVLAVASVMAAAGTGAQAQEPAAATQKTGGEAVGATVVHPAAWNVEREPYTYEDTYEYTLWYPTLARRTTMAAGPRCGSRWPTS